MTHHPVLLQHTVSALLDAPALASGGRVFVDGTFGRGGHARALLAQLPADARLFVFDKDPQAITSAQALATEDARVTVLHEGFGAMHHVLQTHGITQITGLMLDLGVSSPQLDESERGFSFMRDGPLDMRMDTTRGMTAAQWLAQVSVDDLYYVIKVYGEERFAAQIAQTIVMHRARQPLLRTHDLAELVARVVRTHEKGQHPATRTFQALRIYLNQELEELTRALTAALNMLVTGGRLAIISFHSLEDRLVKQSMMAAARPATSLARLPLREHELPQPILRIVARIRPEAAEIARNSRARSAILRVAERTESALSESQAQRYVIHPHPALTRGKRRLMHPRLQPLGATSQSKE